MFSWREPRLQYQNTDQVGRLIALVETIRESKLYGELQVKFEAGKIVVIKKIESIKL